MYENVTSNTATKDHNVTICVVVSDITRCHSADHSLNLHHRENLITRTHAHTVGFQFNAIADGVKYSIA
jgi:hypothetical protein